MSVECKIGDVRVPNPGNSSDSYMKFWSEVNETGNNNNLDFRGDVLTKNYYLFYIVFYDWVQCHSFHNYSNRCVYMCRQLNPTPNNIFDHININNFDENQVYIGFPNLSSPDTTGGVLGGRVATIFVDDVDLTFERLVWAFNMQYKNSPNFTNVSTYSNWFLYGNTTNAKNNRKALLTGIREQTARFNAYDICLFLAAIHRRNEWKPVADYFHRNCLVLGTSIAIPVPIIIDVAYIEGSLLTGSNDVTNAWMNGFSALDATFSTISESPLMSTDAANGVISSFLIKYFNTANSFATDPFLLVLFSISTSNNSTLPLYNATSNWLNQYCTSEKWTEGEGKGWCYNWLLNNPSSAGFTSAQTFCQSNESRIVEFPQLCGCLMSSNYYEGLKATIYARFPELGVISNWNASCQFAPCVSSGLRAVIPTYKDVVCQSQTLCAQIAELDLNGSVTLTQEQQCGPDGITSGGGGTGTNTSTSTNTTTNIFTTQNILIGASVAVILILLIGVVVYLVMDD